MDFADETAVGGETEAPQKAAWLKWVMIGCLVLIILGILASAGCYIAAKYFMHKAADKIMEVAEDELLKQLPEESRDRDRIKAAFRTGTEAFREGNISTDEMKNFQDIIESAMEDGKIESNEVNDIIKYIKAASKDKKTAPSTLM